jgi:hypothetical protein
LKNVLHVLGLTLLLLSVADIALADNPTYPPASCKIKREKLESVIEKFRRNEIVPVNYRGYFLYCRSARPVLKKYILDPDQSIRDMIANYLCCNHTHYNMLLLVAQIETYPLKSASASHQLSFYDPNDFLKMEGKERESLRNALIEYELERARNGEDSLTGTTVKILKNLAPKDVQARQFLADRRRL